MASEGAETKVCPFCAEEILAAAAKCKHCGEFLEGSRGPDITESEERRSTFAPPPVEKRTGLDAPKAILIVLAVVLVAGAVFVYFDQRNKVTDSSDDLEELIEDEGDYDYMGGDCYDGDPYNDVGCVTD